MVDQANPTVAGGAMELDVVEEAKGNLGRASHLPEVQAIVRTAARRAVGADGATFVLRDVDHCYYADEDAMSPLWKGQRFPITNCISGWAMLNARSTVIPDISLDERIPIEAYRPTFVKSLAMVPIGQSHPVGAIGVYWADIHEATASELAAIGDLAEAACVAMERIGLFGNGQPASERPGIDLPADPIAARPIPGGSSSEVAEDHERIARDLHDTVLQKMFGGGLALQNLLRSVDDPDIAAGIRSAIDSIDESIRDLRGVIFGIEYGQPSLSGLSGEILSVAAAAARGLGFKPTIEFDADLPEIGDELRRDVVSAVREMLSNVSRHAGASSVRIDIRSGADLEVQITDDGVGPGRSTTSGQGLGNLSARARARGGRFELAPGEGGGTVARWQVPLPVPAELASE
jgi:hypothetical protein